MLIEVTDLEEHRQLLPIQLSGLWLLLHRGESLAWVKWCKTLRTTWLHIDLPIVKDGDAFNGVEISGHVVFRMEIHTRRVTLWFLSFKNAVSPMATNH